MTPPEGGARSRLGHGSGVTGLTRWRCQRWLPPSEERSPIPVAGVPPVQAARTLMAPEQQDMGDKGRGL